MYSTKRVNKNLVDDNAYITIGDLYVDPKPNPFRQPKKGEKAPNPFQVKMIPQNEENGHFGKLTYQPEGYKESIKYITTQPLDARKKGFGTKDAHKRDEFSNYVRTEQYRETMKKEKFIASQGSAKMKDALTALIQAREDQVNLDTAALSASGKFSYSTQVPQYDIGRSRITEFNPKASKDKYYKFDDERPKRFGMTNKPVSYEVGNSAWDVAYKPPSHGGKSEVKNFSDKSHLNVTREY